MLDNTLTIDYGATTGIVLTRIREDGYASEYRGESGDMKFVMNIKHTIPARGAGGASHLVRLDVEHYDVDGLYVRTSSAWTVIKTFDAPQDETAASNTMGSLLDFIGVSSNIDKIVANES
jgi:hypothetical protein